MAVSRFQISLLFCLIGQLLGPGVVARADTATVLAGKGVEFTVTADGTAPFTYQWFKDDVALEGATGASYVIPSFQVDDAGVYWASVENDAGSTFSDSSTLIMAVPPAITTQPSGATVAAGGAVTFAVAANGWPTPTYQWHKDGVAISGATGSFHTIASVTTASAGTYSLVATNAAGSITSTGAVLTVTNPVVAPLFTLHPAGTTVIAGGAVTFTAAANGSPVPTYQWRRNGVVISGATASSYTIASVATASAGTYSVVAKSSAGSAVSTGAVLTVTVPTIAPVFTTQPAGKTMAAGGAVTFTAAASGFPAPTYQWRKNGTVINGATASSHTIASVTAASAGTYSVVAKNSAGSAVSTGAVLTVTVPPVFTTQPAGKTVAAGGAVTFTAAASGSPAPTYQWRKNGAVINGATASSYTIASVATASAGTYSVVATNSAGTATSSGAVLTVTPPATAPVFTTQPAGATVTTGGAVTFTAAASGSPVPTYQWRKNGAAISGATASAYTIPSVALASAGTYSVVATNAAGAATSANAVLTVALVRSDFNGDGKSDILWQNILTGQHRLWLMAGTSIASAMALNGTSINWDIIGTGDFNSDGKADILWQNLVTREVNVWLMNGTSLASQASLGVPALGRYVAGTGDFNGDGKADIIWQNTTTREFSIVLMNDTTATTTTSLGIVDPAWNVAGTGDFNGDGRTDILWENPVGFQCSVWLMNGTAFASSAHLATVPLNWRIGGTGDFNGDGKVDLLWQNTVTGEDTIRLMSGLTGGSEVFLDVTALGWLMAN